VIHEHYPENDDGLSERWADLSKIIHTIESIPEVGQVIKIFCEEPPKQENVINKTVEIIQEDSPNIRGNTTTSGI
jgi:hypothetical protein